MKTSFPFSISIFVASGDPDGLKVIERTNWNGKSLVFPRALLPELKQREEFARTGVYILLGPREDAAGDMIYIGEGDPVRPRLESHYVNKDFWNRAVFFVASGDGQLNKAHVQYLESRLIEKANTAKRTRLENKQNPNLPSLNEAEKANMEVFLHHILEIVPLIGVSAFDEPDKSNSKSKNTLYIEAKGLKSFGYESTKGFVVQKNSQVCKDEAPSLIERFKSIVEARKELFEAGVIVENEGYWVFSQDYSFSSPSQAAMVVMGRSANGRTEWKTKQGVTLKEIQEKAAKNN